MRIVGRINYERCAVIQDLQDELTWMMGMTLIKACLFLPAAEFPSTPLWPVSTNPKHLSQMKVIDVNRVA
jgi:hypothetical protein